MKNMKKILLSLLLIPSIAIAGCGKDDDSKDTTTNQQQGSGNGSGSGSESGGSQTPAGLTQAEKEAAYAVFYGHTADIANKTTKTVTMESEYEEGSAMTLDTTGLTPEEIETINELMGGGEFSHKGKLKAAYDLDLGTLYKVAYDYDDEAQQYEMDEGHYIVKDGNIWKFYYEEGTEKRAYYVGEKHMEEEFFEDILEFSGFFEFVEGADTLAKFKTALVESMEVYNLTENDVAIEVRKENDVYTLIGKIENFTKDSFYFDGTNLSNLVLNASIKATFNNTELLTFEQEMTMNGKTTVPMGTINANFNMGVDMKIETSFDKSFDTALLAKDYTSFGELENISPDVEIYVNGHRIDGEMLTFGDEIDSELITLLNTELNYSYYGLGDVVGNYYLDPECTISLTSLETIPSYDFKIYTQIDETKVETGTVVLLIVNYNTTYDYEMDARVEIVDLSTLTDNKYELIPTWNGWYELEEVLVDGVAVTGDIVLTDKPLIVITANYVEIE